MNNFKPAQQIASGNEVLPTQVTQSKSQMIETASEVFEQGWGRAGGGGSIRPLSFSLMSMH